MIFISIFSSVFIVSMERHISSIIQNKFDTQSMADRTYQSYLEVSLSGETRDVSVSFGVELYRYSSAVLSGNGVVACDVVEMVLVGEVKEQIVLALRYHFSY